MNKEWMKYYIFLNNLRESGVTNMFGVASYLSEAYKELDMQDARTVLSSWMDNFTEIQKELEE